MHLEIKIYICAIKKLNVLNIYDLCRLQIPIFVYPVIIFSHPNTHIILLTLRKSIVTHCVALNEHPNFYIVSAQKTCHVNALVLKGPTPKYWNSLSIYPYKGKERKGKERKSIYIAPLSLDISKTRVKSMLTIFD